MPKTPVSVSMVAQLIGATIEGDPSVMVRSFAAMDSAGPQDITFAVDEKYAAKLSSCKAAAAVIDRKSAAPDAKMTLLRVDSVQKAVAKLLQFAGEPEDLPQSGIHPTAIIAADAQVAADAAVGPHVVVGARAKIGPGAILCANVWIGADVNVGEKTLLAEGVVVKPTCVIGNRVRIGPNSVIGWDGFGYYPEGGVHHRIPHVGNVVIEDDVDLGACTCIDRAKFGETRIGAGTKIDNLVQIAHNCQIAKGCLIVAQVGVAGSTKLGNYVVIGGNAGLRDNIKIGDGVQIAACAAVANDLPAGMVALGQPATDAKEEIRTIFAGRKLLPTLAAKIKSIEERLKALESTKND